MSTSTYVPGREALVSVSYYGLLISVRLQAVSQPKCILIRGLQGLLRRETCERKVHRLGEAFRAHAERLPPSVMYTEIPASADRGGVAPVRNPAQSSPGRPPILLITRAGEGNAQALELPILENRCSSSRVLESEPEFEPPFRGSAWEYPQTGDGDFVSAPEAIRVLGAGRSHTETWLGRSEE